jgi:hypothetical protein
MSFRESRDFGINPENRDVSEGLRSLLAEIALNVNIDAFEKYRIRNLLDPDCKVSVSGFADPEKGIYDPEVLAESDAEVKAREREFSRATVPAVQEHYAAVHGAHTEDEIVSVWKANRSKEKNGQMEMAVTALLHKVLGKRYLVVRTADYDDYVGGVDNIIVDKETGVVICGFDDVHEGGDGERTQTKQEKVRKIAKKGGARLRFGLEFANGSLHRAALENLPVFYLGLSSEELIELTRNMSYSLSEKPTEMEVKIFSRLLESVRTQLADLKGQDVPFAVKRNLQRFEESLPVIRKTGVRSRAA